MEPQNKGTKGKRETKRRLKPPFRALLKVVGYLNISAAQMMLVGFVPCISLIALAANGDTYLPDRDKLTTQFEEAETTLATESISTTDTTSTTSATTMTTLSTTTTTKPQTTTTSLATTTTTVTTTTTATEPEITEPEIVETEVELVAYDYYVPSRVSGDELIMLAKTVAQEGGDCSYVQQACVIWTVLNRVDSDEWPNSVSENLTKPNQFAYYPGKSYRDDHYQVALDVVTAWETGNGTRYLSSDYQYFYGDGRRNHFYCKYGAEYVPD